ncbi:hypothetical protein VTN77DRAFT_5911 [Rasamsonia byssochlamydoides]|uniref:uncharacterized protein n=1 Tax=Rasamsonia byssochlamydoides TaxID=89139 RepID=UPI0037447436
MDIPIIRRSHCYCDILGHILTKMSNKARCREMTTKVSSTLCGGTKFRLVGLTAIRCALLTGDFLFTVYKARVRLVPYPVLFSISVDKLLLSRCRAQHRLDDCGVAVVNELVSATCLKNSWPSVSCMRQRLSTSRKDLDSSRGISGFLFHYPGRASPWKIL